MTDTLPLTALDYRSFVPTQGFLPCLALSPDGTRVAYSSSAAGQYDLWIHPLHGGPAQRLTRNDRQAVRQIAWAPDGTWLAYTADTQGDEQHQIHRINATGGPSQPLTTAAGQHILAGAPFDPSGRLLTYAANDRDPAVQDLIIHDLHTGLRRRHMPPDGLIYEPRAVSPDGHTLLIAAIRSNTEIDAHLLDLINPDAIPSLATAGDGGFHSPAGWAPDSRGFYLTTSQWGEFITAAYQPLDTTDTAGAQPIAKTEWDAESVIARGDTLLWTVNEAGTSIPHARRGGHELKLPELPPSVIKAITLSPDASTAVLLLEAATRPAEIGVIDLTEGTFTYLTDTRPPALHIIEPVQPDTITFPATDGHTLHAFLYRPHGQGPFPALMHIHGGPEAQERPDYVRSGLYQHLLAHGIAVFAPNIAGSTGYGRTYQQAINRDWGGIDLRHLTDAVGHLTSREWIEKDRIAVAGGSYGGFATLTCLSRIPHPWAAGISICGPTNLVTLARACPPTWRHFVNNALGNPDDPDDIQRLTAGSPITHAHNITAPLLLIQGAQDPRVPQAEADQLVKRLRALGTPVEYDLYPDEGHGFTNRTNEIGAYTNAADFLLRHLKPNVPQRRRDTPISTNAQ